MYYYLMPKSKILSEEESILSKISNIREGAPSQNFKNQDLLEKSVDPNNPWGFPGFQQTQDGTFANQKQDKWVPDDLEMQQSVPVDDSNPSQHPTPAQVKNSMHPQLKTDKSIKKKNRSPNQTKNIPKNFGKAIITFINKNKEKFIEKLAADPSQFEQMGVLLKQAKNQINTIADIRDMWSQFKYARWVRIISNDFLRRHGVKYVFNSRVSSHGTHIKYRNRLIEALKSPLEFNHIKEF